MRAELVSGVGLVDGVLVRAVDADVLTGEDRWVWLGRCRRAEGVDWQELVDRVSSVLDGVGRSAGARLDARFRVEDVLRAYLPR